jgi:hypothetical protein
VIRLTPRTRRVLAWICLFWVVVAAARVIEWAAGAPIDPVSLALSVVSGVCGLICLALYLAAGRCHR